MEPLKVLQQSVKAVPAMKYALGVAGMAATVALVLGLKLQPLAAVLGSSIVLGLMFVLLEFSRYAEKRHSDRRDSSLIASPASSVVLYDTVDGSYTIVRNQLFLARSTRFCCSEIINSTTRGCRCERKQKSGWFGQHVGCRMFGISNGVCSQNASSREKTDL